MIFFFYFLISLVISSEIPDFYAQYTNVDEVNNANVFWWMYGSQTTTRDSDSVVIWLQGGPGGSSLMGDLCEIGPVDLQCGDSDHEGSPIEREYVWSKIANLIFIDQPVGTGFSYVENKEGYTHSEDQIASELLIVLKSIYEKFPILKTNKNKIWIFSESYGGKMNSFFTTVLYDAIFEKKTMDYVNLGGIGLGDSWISGESCCKSYGDFLLATSNMNEKEAAQTNSYASDIETCLSKGEYSKATDLWGQQQQYISDQTAGLNWYNIELHHSYDSTNLTNYVNTVMRSKFNAVMPSSHLIPSSLQWAEGSGAVFEYLAEDFMKPVVDKVDELLKNGVNVLVYSGSKDLIVNVLCTRTWMNQLTWSGYSKFQEADKIPIQFGDNVAYKQSYQNFALYMIRGGHMIPQDNQVMAFKMFKEYINGQTN